MSYRHSATVALVGLTSTVAIVVYPRGGLLVRVGLVLIPSMISVVLVGYPLSRLGRLPADER
ncbi:MAG: hypothetical protein J07HX64_02942 [halophilic archaeon J07HX64]|nr:MAG: hypothetical protein J07HX64_02942 [halophilic archaeon J07HX64]